MGKDVEKGECVTGGPNNFGLVCHLGGVWAEMIVLSYFLCIPLVLCKWYNSLRFWLQMRAAIQNKLTFLLFPFEVCIWISVGIRMSLIEVYCWQVIVLPNGLLFLYIHFHWLNLWNIPAPVFSNSCFTVLLKNYPWRTLPFFLSLLILFSSVLLCSLYTLENGIIPFLHF